MSIISRLIPESDENVWRTPDGLLVLACLAIGLVAAGEFQIYFKLNKHKIPSNHYE